MDTENMFSELLSAVQLELRKQGFRGSKLRMQKVLPEATLIAFHTKDRATEEDREQKEIRFQISTFVYLKSLDEFFRAGQDPKSFGTVDADSHMTLGGNEDAHLWWCVSPRTSLENMRSELVDCVREMCVETERQGSLLQFFETNMHGFKQGNLQSRVGLVRLAFVAKLLRRKEEAMVLREAILDKIQETSDTYFLRKKLEELDAIQQ